MRNASCSTCPTGLEQELTVLCSFICACNKIPDKAERKLRGKVISVNIKQGCVNKGLDWYRADGQGQTIHSEVGYNMTTAPPVPLMLKDKAGLETTNPINEFAHRVNRIRKMQGKKGIVKGDLRIPDVVVTNAANQIPTQNNIKQVVEIKFPGDKWGAGQKEAYEEIAGNDPMTDEPKLLEMTPNKCGCGDQKQPQTQPVAVSDSKLAQAWQDERDRLSSNSFVDVGIVVGGVIAIVALVLDDLLPFGVTQADDVLIPVVGGAMARSVARLLATFSRTAVAVPLLGQ